MYFNVITIFFVLNQVVIKFVLVFNLKLVKKTFHIKLLSFFRVLSEFIFVSGHKYLLEFIF